MEFEVEVEVVKLGPEKGSHRVHQQIVPSKLLKYDGGVDVGPSADKRAVRGAWACSSSVILASTSIITSIISLMTTL